MKKLPLTLLALLGCTILFAALIANLPSSSAPVLQDASQKTASQEASFDKYVNEEKHYSIEYPADWQKQELPRLDIVILSPPKDQETQTRATMNLVSEAVNPPITLDAFYEESVKGLKEELKATDIEKQGAAKINGIPSKWIQYNHEMMGSRFRVLQYFLVIKDHLYLITFSSVANDFEEFRPIFEKIATSFKEVPGP